MPRIVYSWVINLNLGLYQIDYNGIWFRFCCNLHNRFKIIHSSLLFSSNLYLKMDGTSSLFSFLLIIKNKLPWNSIKIVQNSFCCDMSMSVFDFHDLEPVRGQKRYSEWTLWQHNVQFILRCHFCLPKKIKKIINVHQ